MAELAIRSVRKMTHADWLTSCAISFSYRPASFGRKIAELIRRKIIKIRGRFTEDLQEQTTKKEVKCSQR